MTRDPHTALLIEIKESIARIEQRLIPIEQKAEMGVQGFVRSERLETRLTTIWTTLIAIPVLGAVLAYIGWIGPTHVVYPQDLAQK